MTRFLSCDIFSLSEFRKGISPLQSICYYTRNVTPTECILLHTFVISFTLRLFFSSFLRYQAVRCFSVPEYNEVFGCISWKIKKVSVLIFPTPYCGQYILLKTYCKWKMLCTLVIFTLSRQSTLELASPSPIQTQTLTRWWWQSCHARRWLVYRVQGSVSSKLWNVDKRSWGLNCQSLAK